MAQTPAERATEMRRKAAELRQKADQEALHGDPKEARRLQEEADSEDRMADWTESYGR